MPITKSAKKSVRQVKRKTEHNREIKKQITEAIKEARKAVAAGAKDINEKIKKAQKFLDRAAKISIIHKNTASRKLSRLVKRKKKGIAKKETKGKKETS